MISRRSFFNAASLASMGLILPNRAGASLPKIFHWRGNPTQSVLYWDDPNNWVEGAVPNEPETTIIFADALKQNTTILLRQEVQLANVWFSEPSYSYTIAPDPKAVGSPGLKFVSAQPFVNLVLGPENKTSHYFPCLILHSCQRYLQPFGNIRPKLDENTPSLQFLGPVRNHHPSRRASVGVSGPLRVVLGERNDYTGPVIIEDGILVIKKTGAIPDGTQISLDPAGRLQLDENVIVKTSSFSVNNRQLPPGLYHAHDTPLSSKIAALFGGSPPRALSEISGAGVLQVI